MNKKKIINDPVYGFISIPDGLVFEIIEHPFVQRLRRIKQLGMTDLVYPGANHTRFHHALGAMHLMSEALNTLRGKGVQISDEEYESALIAILLHDVGHGPFSHALEFSILPGVEHEDITVAIVNYLDELFKNRLDLVKKIIQGQYDRKFFNQLVSSQLDTDRMDYLNRDSYFTGVSEGKIGSERILKMLNLINNEIVVEEKAIYSIENFLSARRLMYWQVYLHKTTVGAEKMLIKIIQRAKYLVSRNVFVESSPAFKVFLSHDYSLDDFISNRNVLNNFLKLDDTDILGAIKIWQDHPDLVLSTLSRMLLNRDLFKVRLSGNKTQEEELNDLINKVSEKYSINPEDARYLISEGSMTNAAYISGGQRINVLMKDGNIIDIADAADLPNIAAMSKIVKKYYLCWPKIVSL
ncbi:HD domain-containing protein [Bacteroidota bacterium]